jgi:general secretion pathway protein G
MKKLSTLLCVFTATFSIVGSHAAEEVSRVEADFKAIRSALEYYKLNAGGYPTTEQGLVALVKKPKLPPRPKRWMMIMSKVPVDPWKREYQYELIEGEIHLWSKGKDVDDPKDDTHSPVRKAGTPEVVLMAYYKALKNGDLEKAKAMTAKFKTLPNEYLNKYTEKYSKLAKDGEMVMKLEPKSMKVIGDCAVVTFKDGDKKRPDYDPAYLVKQNGEWKILLKFTQWGDRRFTFSDEQKIRFTELKTWFRSEKDRLYGRN